MALLTLAYAAYAGSSHDATSHRVSTPCGRRLVTLTLSLTPTMWLEAGDLTLSLSPTMWLEAGDPNPIPNPNHVAGGW